MVIRLTSKRFSLSSKLHSLGFEIGSHSLTHPYLSKIDPQKAWEEINTSKVILEDKLGTEIRAFCYPYGGLSFLMWIGFLR